MPSSPPALWDLSPGREGELRGLLQGHEGSVNYLAFHPHVPRVLVSDPCAVPQHLR